MDSLGVLAVIALGEPFTLASISASELLVGVYRSKSPPEVGAKIKLR